MNTGSGEQLAYENGVDFKFYFTHKNKEYCDIHP